MIATRVLERKRDGESLEPDELRQFLRSYLRGDVAEYQMAAFLMAVFHAGLDSAELDVLVESMVGSGAVLDFSDLGRPVVDKHSTGGVGDKVSLALAPLAAELGVVVPMMSGRGLGHTTGTLDKLEAIPGFRTDLDLARFRAVLSELGVAMIGQTSDIAPLDRRLYALRDVTATVPSLPLIASSIMSKKVAEGLDALVLDVKVGEGAFLDDLESARELADTMVRIGGQRGVRTVARLTQMGRPLGRACGNGLETAEAIDCLRGGGPADLRLLVIELAAEMAVLGALDPDLETARARAAAALDDGRALERFRRLCEAQGGDPSVTDAPESLETARDRARVLAETDGHVQRVSARTLGWGVIELGGGRTRIEQDIHPGVGFVLSVAPGDTVSVGDPLGEVHASGRAGLEAGQRCLRAAVEVGPEDPGPQPPLLIERRTIEGVHGSRGSG